MTTKLPKLIPGWPQPYFSRTPVTRVTSAVSPSDITLPLGHQNFIAWLVLFWIQIVCLLPIYFDLIMMDADKHHSDLDRRQKITSLHGPSELTCVATRGLIFKNCNQRKIKFLKESILLLFSLSNWLYLTCFCATLQIIHQHW